MRPSESDRWSSIDILDEEKEEDGEDNKGKESMLKLFLMVREEEFDMCS